MKKEIFEFEDKFGIPILSDTVVQLELAMMGFNISIEEIMFKKLKISELKLNQFKNIEIFI